VATVLAVAFHLASSGTVLAAEAGQTEDKAKQIKKDAKRFGSSHLVGIKNDLLKEQGLSAQEGESLQPPLRGGNAPVARSEIGGLVRTARAAFDGALAAEPSAEEAAPGETSGLAALLVTAYCGKKVIASAASRKAAWGDAAADAARKAGAAARRRHPAGLPCKPALGLDFVLDERTFRPWNAYTLRDRCLEAKAGAAIDVLEPSGVVRRTAHVVPFEARQLGGAVKVLQKMMKSMRVKTKDLEARPNRLRCFTTFEVIEDASKEKGWRRRVAKSARRTKAAAPRAGP
jgi:hypothetical protein